jgi:3',5'-cyclic AMP phosphodiesterase CpdA
MPPVAASDLINKRAIGYFNWRRNRIRIYDNAVVDALLADIRAARPDHIAVTGDLANIGLPAEFENARDWLTTLGRAEDVSVIPGNHDAYVPGAFEALSRTWRPFMSGDEANGEMFPYVRRRGPLALIGVSTAVASLPLMAIGRVGEAQVAGLERALEQTGRDGLFRIVLIHHSPVTRATQWERRLVDASRVRAAIARQGAELILHGHNHRTSVLRIAGPNGTIPVVGAASASVRPGTRRPGGSYNLIRIEGEPGDYTVTMAERRFCNGGSVATKMEQRLVG